MLARWGSRARSLLTTPHLLVAELRCRQPVGPPGAEHSDEAPWFVVPRRGLVSWQVHGRSNLVVPGRLLWFAPGERFRFGHPVTGGDDCLVLSPSPRLCAEVFGRAGFAVDRVPSTMVPLPAPASFAAEVLARAAAGGTGGGADGGAEDGADAVDDDRLAEFAAHFLGTLAGALRRGPDSVATPANRPEGHAVLVHQAATFLAAHYAEPIPRPLDAAAAAVRCSPFHLARVFRREVGSTVHTFRERLRLAAGLRAIADGASSLAQLADRLGYASHSHFTGNFRRAYGLSPGAARLALSGGCEELGRIMEAAPVD